MTKKSLSDFEHVFCITTTPLHYQLLIAVRPDTWSRTIPGSNNTFFLLLDSADDSTDVVSDAKVMKNALLQAWNEPVSKETDREDGGSQDDSLRTKIKESEFSRCIVMNGSSPQQRDCINCGLFAIKNLEKYLQLVTGDGSTYTREQILNHYKETNSRTTWFEPSEVTEMRTALAASINRYCFKCLCLYQIFTFFCFCLLEN